jgi:hypothetical protein
VADAQIKQTTGEGTPSLPKNRPCRGRAFQLAAVALTIVSALAGTGLARWLRLASSSIGGGGETAKADPELTLPDHLFKDWPKPDLVMLLSAQQHGYILPCGCSRPQIGGLERRYNLVKLLKAKDWPYCAIDLGDLAQKSGPVDLPNLQGLIKYRYSMEALKKMDYAAVSFGGYDASLSLEAALGAYALQFPKPRVVAANLLNAEESFPEQTKPFEVVSPKGSDIKVGVTAVIGPTVEDKIIGPTAAKKIQELKVKARDSKNPADKAAIEKELAAYLAKLPVAFGPSGTALQSVLKKMAGDKVNLRVLLYQGPPTRNAMKRPPTEAVAAAEAFPEFPIVLALSQEDEASAAPLYVTHKSGARSMIISVGRKGKHVGVVGVYKTGKADKPFKFRYQLVELTEEFLTPKKERKDHPISKLMEDYTAELKKDDYLNKYGQTRHLLQVLPPVKGLANPGEKDEPRFVGSEKCKRCHDDAYKIWKKTPHSHAYKTLVDEKYPSNRQFDPECIVCHTVGFGNVSGFKDAVKTPHLKNVGCESCHGPASLHVKNPKNEEWQKRLNPWKAKEKETEAEKTKRIERMDIFCQRCHDAENDVNWKSKDGKPAFIRKWPSIEHMTPKPAD